MRKLLKEFKEFALKGNVLDLSVAVVIGGAFGKIVTSLVNDIIMPLVSILTGGVSFSYLMIVIKEAEGDIPATTFNYGAFIQNVIDFIIIAISIFMFIKLISNFKRKKEVVVVQPEPAKVSDEVLLLQEIRDLLKQK